LTLIPHLGRDPLQPLGILSWASKAEYDLYTKYFYSYSIIKRCVHGWMDGWMDRNLCRKKMKGLSR
jgi:hypothetical protein